MVFDLTVGIDVGMSTGVAYRQSKTGGVDCDVVFLKWGSNEQIKVSTKLAYARTDDSQPPLHWGLNIPDTTENLSVKGWFKTDFGGNGSNQAEAERNAEAERLYSDYLKCLHDELSQRFVRDGILGKAWKHANIPFVFSTPACWEPPVVAQFKTLISKAGFEKSQSKRLGRGVHTVAITMTEPQATAAFELHTPQPAANLRRDHNVMIIDVGAGTGDFSLLQDAINAQETLHWREHQPAIGQNIGPWYIDLGFEARMTEILKPYQHLLSHSASHVAWEIRRGTRLLHVKHEFRGANVQSKTIPVPHLGDGQRVHDDTIQDGHFINPETELEPLFDQQVKTITDCIFERASQRNEPLESLQSCSIFPQDYLLRSGGLGSSLYVKRQLETFCNDFSMLKSTKLVVSRQPQLAVYMPPLPTRPPFLRLLAARYSVSLVACRALPLLKRTWISILTRGKGLEGRFDDCVDWIIPKGKQIQNGGELEFERKLFFEPGERRLCNIEIVCSLADGLSPLKGSEFIATHQVMRASFSEADAKKKRKVLWRKGHFFQVEFKIKAIIGLAQTHFLCWLPGAI
ncbi:hypothetical protein NCS52_01280900 [Fusarium sp. LHS14.1]|nr:hypothetical protein NCS52_01280900 [Fusarium sp. LHS14.1]